MQPRALNTINQFHITVIVIKNVLFGIIYIDTQVFKNIFVFIGFKAAQIYIIIKQA